MASYNHVTLMGHLVAAPELRYTPNGAAVATMRIGVNHKYTKDGESVEEASFFNIVAWGAQAENCSQYLEKGQPILVDGRLRSRNWETPDGQKRTAVEVVAGRVIFLVKGGGNGGYKTADDGPGAYGDFDDVPF